MSKQLVKNNLTVYLPPSGDQYQEQFWKSWSKNNFLHWIKLLFFLFSCIEGHVEAIIHYIYILTEKTPEMRKFWSCRVLRRYRAIVQQMSCTFTSRISPSHGESLGAPAWIQNSWLWSCGHLTSNTALFSN